MLISWLYNYLGSKEDVDKEDLVFGLGFVLVFGLVVGLVFGLPVDLVVDLGVGLAGGLVFGLVDIFNTSLEYFIVVLLAIFVISECLYWLDKHRWDHLDRWGNTLVKKTECILETGLVVVNVCNIVNHYRDIINFFGTQQETVRMVLSFVGYGTIIVLIIAGYVWFNSLRYKESGIEKVSDKKKEENKKTSKK